MPNHCVALTRRRQRYLLPHGIMRADLEGCDRINGQVHRSVQVTGCVLERLMMQHADKRGRSVQGVRASSQSW
jgi:hypothetical protein